MAQIAAIYALINTIYGSQLAKDFLGLFIKNGQLTDAQAASLQANHLDYQKRILARDEA